MKDKIPAAKKRLQAFLVGEEGKISKHSIVKASMVFGAAAITSALSQVKDVVGHASHYSADSTQACHVSHASHASHSSHASHCNWG